MIDGTFAKATFSFDDEGATRVFRFMDGICDLYVPLLDRATAKSLLEHLSCFVSRQFDVEPARRLYPPP